MSHSTHVGFNCPPSEAITAWSRRSFSRLLPDLRVRLAGELPLCIDVTEVGHILTAVCRFTPPCRFGPTPAPVPPLARGVGQKRTQRSRETDLFVSGLSVSVEVDCRSIW